MDSLVSVIVPVYNSEKYIHRCFDSIINQSYNNIEIIFINDGSTDNSLSIIESFKMKYNNVVVINQENQGQSIARNRGMDICNGNYFMFVDSDDYIHCNMIELLLNNIIKYDKDIAICRYTKIYNNSCVEIKLNCNSYSNNSDIIEQMLLSNIISSPCGKLFKNTIKNNLKFPEHKLFEDSYVMIDLIVKYNLLYVDVDGYYYDLRNNDSSTRNPNIVYHYNDLIEALDISKKSIDLYYPELNSCMEYNLFINYYNLYKNCISLNVFDSTFNIIVYRIKHLQNKSIIKYSNNFRTVLKYLMIKYFNSISLLFFKLKFKSIS